MKDNNQDITANSIKLNILGTTHEFVKQDDADTFRFECRSDCTRCCENSNVVLSPYDLQRVLKRTEITFSDFLEKYAIMFNNPDLHGMLSIKLKTNPACRFLKEGLCSIYTDRPLGCRMYPLGLYKLRKEVIAVFNGKDCPGFNSDDRTIGKTMTVQQWKEESEIEPYINFFKVWDTISTYFDHYAFPKDDQKFVKIFYILAYDIWSEDNAKLLSTNGYAPSEDMKIRLTQSMKLLFYYLKEFYIKK